MTDTVSAAKRSWIMGRVRGKDTTPELRVRSLAHRMGYRFRLHRRDMPGVPDLVFTSLRKIVFVHGCFWHGHDCSRGSRIPQTNVTYWTQKVAGNKARDQRNIEKLTQAGWQAAIVWECHLRDEKQVTKALSDFLGPRCTEVYDT